MSNTRAGTETKSIMEYVKTGFGKRKTDQYGDLQKLREVFRKNA